MATASRPIEVAKFFHIARSLIVAAAYDRPCGGSCRHGNLIDDLGEDGFNIHTRPGARANQHEAVFEYRMHEPLDVVGYHETAPVDHRERLRSAKERAVVARAPTEIGLGVVASAVHDQVHR